MGHYLAFEGVVYRTWQAFAVQFVSSPPLVGRKLGLLTAVDKLCPPVVVILGGKGVVQVTIMGSRVLRQYQVGIICRIHDDLKF
jgi:hypothetical protein